MRGNPDFVASSAHGVTGIVALSLGPDATPEFRDIRLSLSEDGETLTVEIEGLPSYELLRETNVGAGGGQWGFGIDPTAKLFNRANTGEIDFATFNSPFNLNQAIGTYGHVTPLERLPTGGATYSGGWSLDHPSNSDPTARNSAGGQFDMTVGFDDGQITGMISDGRNSFFETVEYGGTGTITGSVTGNGVSGSLTMNTENASTTAVFEGSIFGWDGKDIGGALVGTTTGGGNTNAVFGSFEGSTTSP